MKSIKRFNDSTTWFNSIETSPNETGIFFVSDGEAFGLATYTGTAWQSPIPVSYWAWTTRPIDAVPGIISTALGYIHVNEVELLLKLSSDLVSVIAPHQGTDPDADVAINETFSALTNLMEVRTRVAAKVAAVLLDKEVIDEKRYQLLVSTGEQGAKEIFTTWWRWSANNVSTEEFTDEQRPVVTDGNVN